MTPLVLIPGMMCDAIGADSVADIATAILKDVLPRFALAGPSMGGIVAREILRQALSLSLTLLCSLGIICFNRKLSIHFKIHATCCFATSLS